MRVGNRSAWRRAVLALLLFLLPALAAAEEADFYKGRQVRLLIGFPPGGGDDALARLLARFLPNHLAGHPTIVPENEPGAGSLAAANALFNTAPRDGSTFGAVHSFVPLMPLLGLPGGRFAALDFTYIGSMAHQVGLCIAMKSAGFRSIEDTRHREFLVGTSGAGTELTTFYGTIASMLGARLRIIKGYGSALEVNAAMDRGELQGRCGVSWSVLKNTRPDWLAEKKIDFLLQLSATKHPELPDVPLIGEWVKDPLDREALDLLLASPAMGVPFLAPPGLPPARAALLRAGFAETVRDPGLVAEATRQRLEISPMPGAEMQALVQRLYALPAPVASRARALVGGDKAAQ